MEPVPIVMNPHSESMQIMLVDRGQGYGRLQLPFHEELVWDPAQGTMHGGVITALLDTAGGVAVAISGGRPQATLDLRIDRVRPATPGKDLFGDARMYRLDRHVAFVRGCCHHGDPEEAFAQMTATYMVADQGPSDEQG